MPQPTWRFGTSDASHPPLVHEIVEDDETIFNIPDELDILAILVRMVEQHGAIFRVNIMGRMITVMAGLEANRFFVEAGERLSKRGIYGGFDREWGEHAHLSAIDGSTHTRLRQVVRKGYARSRVIERVGEIVDITRQHIQSWQAGESRVIVDETDILAANQMGQFAAHSLPDGLLRDLRIVVHAHHMVFPMRVWSLAMLYMPTYQRAKQRIFDFAKSIIAERQASSENNAPDLLDDLLTAHAKNPDFYTHDKVLAQLLTAYTVGVNSASSTTAYLLYLLHKNPHILAQIRAEIEQVGTVTTHNVNELVLVRQAVLETTRLYPVAPFLLRKAAVPFEFGGYAVEVGSEIASAVCVTHYLPEFYANPQQFQLDREPAPPNAFAGFGLAAHTCIGAGMAEIQIAATVATILQAIEFDPLPAAYIAPVNTKPIPNPGPDFTLRIKSINRVL
jgi:cytochrome P450